MWISRAWRARWPGAAEVVLFLVLTVVYEWARDLVAPQSAADIAAAYRNATDLVSFEGGLGLHVEPDIQRITQSIVGGEFATTWYYTLAHTPGFIIFFWLVWRFWREHYAYIRNWFWAAHVAAVTSFALFPLAPPRLDNPALEDTTHEALKLGGALDWFQGFRNEYAAMPSLHIGYNVFYALVLTWLLRPIGRIRYLVWILPLWMTWVTAATANHYCMHGVGGAACVLAGGVVVHLVMVKDLPRPWRQRAVAT